ncbi:MAG TPA: L,D-transpeptidase [Solirubrobacteraceae bacterium]|nr:L,D-transpeptidase [Solirubrobacteraceae bacterium]
MPLRRPVGILAGLLVAGLLLAAALIGAAPARAAVSPSQTVVTLTANHAIYARPGGRREATISRRRPITGEATTLPVLAMRPAAGTRWLRVRLPGRLLPGAPNGRTGWITFAHTRLWAVRWHIVVALGQRKARIYQGGRLRRTFRVVVGAPATPTPTGRFFVEENIAEPPTFPGAPYALALSARSAVFTEFDGGPGQVALHGVGGGLGGTLGTAESHGCVRFATSAITWLAARIYPGTPVTITR